MAAILSQFSSAIPNNGDGDPLWSTYLGEDPNQTYTLSAGSMLVRTNAGGVYLDFRPRNGGYSFAANAYAQHKITSGSWDVDFNRLTFIGKTDCAVTRNTNGGDNLQIGTYVRSHSEPDNASQGRHYYHLFDMTYHPNRWFKVFVNGHPQHQVGYSPGINWFNNPESVSASNIGYMNGLTRFYFDTQGESPSWPAGYANTNWFFDNFAFDKVTGEPDYEVSSIIAMYTGTRYQVVWAALKNYTIGYEVRYSSASMKPSSFSSGISGGTVNSTEDDYCGVIWNSPLMSEYTSGIYIAIKPNKYPSSAHPASTGPATPGSFTEIYLPYNLNPDTDILGTGYPTSGSSTSGSSTSGSGSSTSGSSNRLGNLISFGVTLRFA